MFCCLKCGKELKVGEKFCESCGEKTQYADMKFGQITFKRDNNYFGCVIPFKIFVDGERVGTISSGATSTFNYPVGEHEVAINSSNDKKRRTINVSEGKEVIINVTTNMWAFSFTAKGKIKSIVEE